MLFNKKVLFFIITIILMLLGYQNCGLPIGGSSHSSSLGGCSVDLIPSFASGHHAFFQKYSCNNCHSPGGIGNGKFAQADVPSAFAEFQIRGPAKIRAKLQSGHQSYNFGELEPDLAVAEKLMQDTIDNASCSKNTGPYKTAEKTLVFFEDELMFGKKRILVQSDGSNTTVSPDFKKVQTIVFDLDDGVFQPAVPGAQVSMDVEVFYDEDFFFPTHYLVKNPKIKSPQQKLRVLSMTVLLNNDPHLVTTFQGVDLIVDKTTAFIPVDPGGASAVFLKAEDDIYDNSDAWSIKFELIENL